MDAATLQWLLTGLLFPVLAAGFTITWRRIDRNERHDDEKRREIWAAIDADRQANHAWQLDATRRFVSTEAQKALKEDMDRRFDRLEALIRGRGGAAP